MPNGDYTYHIGRGFEEMRPGVLSEVAGIPGRALRGTVGGVGTGVVTGAVTGVLFGGPAGMAVGAVTGGAALLVKAFKGLTETTRRLTSTVLRFSRTFEDINPVFARVAADLERNAGRMRRRIARTLEPTLLAQSRLAKETAKSYERLATLYNKLRARIEVPVLDAFTGLVKRINRLFGVDQPNVRNINYLFEAMRSIQGAVARRHQQLVETNAPGLVTPRPPEEAAIQDIVVRRRRNVEPSLPVMPAEVIQRKATRRFEGGAPGGVNVHAEFYLDDSELQRKMSQLARKVEKEIWLNRFASLNGNLVRP